MTIKLWSLAMATALGIAWSNPASAELPPQYTTWQDFAAVATLPAIPDVLGVVDRIERADAGKYIVRAGSCFVEVTIVREAPRGPNGQIIVGPTRIADVRAGERRCN
jgi:hypothetical protein